MTQVPAGEQPGDAGPDFPADMMAMRELLTVVALTRVALARKLAMSPHDLGLLEDLMLGSPSEQLGPAELSRRLGVSTPAITQSVTRLVAAGHLTRRAHPADGRRQTLELTPSGAGHVMGALGPLLGMLGESSSRLSERDRRVIVRYLDDETRSYRAFLAREEVPADSSPAG